MPSHLTRSVFRSILANQPVAYRGCLHRAPRPRPAAFNGLQLPQQAQRRTFLANLFRQKRKSKSPELPPGLKVLTDVWANQAKSMRLPPPEDVAAAFTEFFPDKGKQYEEFHLQHAVSAYKYLQESALTHGAQYLSTSQLVRVYSSLVLPPDSSDGVEHVALAKLIYGDLQTRWEEKDKTDRKLRQAALMSHLRVLCLYGHSLEAREIARTEFAGPVASDAPNSTKNIVASVWKNILAGFAREKSAEELNRTVDIMRECSLPLAPSMQTVLVSYYSTLDFAETQRWYEEPVFNIKDGQPADPHPNATVTILKTCAARGDVKAGIRIVSALLDEKQNKLPEKDAWDAVFVWSAAIGKGVDEVERMMRVMMRKTDELREQDPALPQVYPDIATINALVEYSIEKKDPYAAERYIILGEKLGIYPDANTYVMQMQYRLAANDVDGAKAAYYGLEGPKDAKSVQATNQLIRAMCGTKQHHFDDIMAIVDDLFERKARFEPETIAALCLLHLQRGEFHDAVDLIQVHAHHYSPPQRLIIRKEMLNFLLDRKNSTRDAWDTYQITRKLFPDTPRTTRIQILNEFFDRKRPDMACHVFFHMRNHWHEHYNATKEVYMAAFNGFGRCGDQESLELAVNQLKLDLNVDLDTPLRNSLMLAYVLNQDGPRALDYWYEIAASKEGPTYSSIAIAFRACEIMPWGDQHAKPIWNRLQHMGVDIDRDIFTAYLCALARNQLFPETLQMLKDVEQEFGFEPDLYMLGNWYNALANIERQAQAEAWLKRTHTDIWNQLVQRGSRRTYLGHREFEVEQDLRVD